MSSSCVSQLREALRSVEVLVRDLEPALLDASLAKQLALEFARGERLCSAGKALAARRFEECGMWRAAGYRSGAHWLAEQSGVTVGAAEGALRTARTIEELPATASAFRAGELSEVQAHEITEAAACDPSAEIGLLEAATTSSVKSLRSQCRQVRAASVADDEAWAAKQHLSRRLDRWTDDLGMRRGDWKLPPQMAAALDVALDDEIDRLWRAAGKDARREPRAAFAADAVVNLVTRGPLKLPEVKLTVDLAALERGHVEGDERCQIEGIGPVPVTVARALFEDSRVSLLISDDNESTHVTSPKPTIPRRIRRRLEARAPACENGECGNDGHLEIDHIIAREDGGQTELSNLWRLCSHCHRLKTYLNWLVVPDDHGRPHLVPP